MFFMKSTTIFLVISSLINICNAQTVISIGTIEPGTNNFPLSVNTIEGRFYLLQRSVDLTSFTDLGLVVEGSGTNLNFLVPRDEQRLFFRVIENENPDFENLSSSTQLDRQWINELENRSFGTIFTNQRLFEIKVFIRVGPSSNADSGASRPLIQTRANETAPWLTIGGTRTSTRFLQQVGDINATIPSGWQYRLTDAFSVTPLTWNELK